MDGDIEPTFKQLQDFSNYTKIPFGYLLLAEPPEEKIELLEFRTIDTEQINKPSRALIDTISQMEAVKYWMNEYYIREGYGEHPLVNSLSYEGNDNIKNASKYIKDSINLEKSGKKGPDTRSILNLKK